MKKNKNEYYRFMEPYFTKGDEVQIALAKKNYRRQYKANWKKENRNQHKELTLRFTYKEYEILKNKAKAHHSKLSPFVKLAYQAYINKTYVVPEPENIQRIVQLLKMMYIAIENFIEENGDNSIGNFLMALQDLERQIRIAIISPLELEQVIRKRILEYPEMKNYLLTLIQTL